jgi:DNA-binding response OmpR family regulator
VSTRSLSCNDCVTISSTRARKGVLVTPLLHHGCRFDRCACQKASLLRGVGMLESVHSVLFVEDDDRLREATQEALRRDGFEVRAAPDGIAGLQAFDERHPDLALLDVMMPRMDGVTLCREIRNRSVIPIVLLSARSDPIDVVVGLEAGADDYVTKPFDTAVLSARLRALMRRIGRLRDASLVRVAHVEIDEGAMTVHSHGELVHLTATEFRLLANLARNAGVVRTRPQLLEDVWEYSWAGDTRLVDVHVLRLRAKLGVSLIETVRGVGYKIARP